MNFITNLLQVKNFVRVRTLALLSFFLLFFSLSTCTPQPKSNSSAPKYSITDEERVWLREFFHDLLFEDPGAYVLYGTKPISLSCLEDPPTEEQAAQGKAWVESLSPEEKAKHVVATKPCHILKANFQKWEQIKHRFPINQYLFGRFSNPYHDDVENLFFVNIEQTARTLLANYEDFHRVLGYDFDPLQVVFDIENRDSKFWNQVQKNHALLGILLGFGKDNSWFFEWMIQYQKIPGKVGDFFASLPSKFYQEMGQIYAPTTEDFFLPVCRSYGLHPNDKELFEQYKKDQQKIKALYKGRDEVDVALEWLTR